VPKINKQRLLIITDVMIFLLFTLYPLIKEVISLYGVDCFLGQSKVLSDLNFDLQVLNIKNPAYRLRPR